MSPSPLDTVRYPRSRLEIQWNGVDWVDESGYLISHSGEMRITGPGEDLVAPGDIGSATVQLWNDGRFSWLGGGTLSPYIGGPTGMYGIRARILVGFGTTPGGGADEWHTIFTGVIYDWEENSRSRTVSLELRDPGHMIVQKRMSTGVYQKLTVNDWVERLADLAGVTERVLDPSPAQVDYCWLDDESILGEIWEVARAEGGRAYFDRGGTFHYEHPSHWALGHGTPAWVLDESHYSEVVPEVSVDELVSAVTVEVQPRAVSIEQELYSLDTARTIPPLGTAVLDCRMNYPALSVGTDYELVTSAGAALGSYSLTTTAYAQRVQVQIVNLDSVQQAYLTKLTIRGVPLIGGPTLEIREQVSGSVSMDRVRGISGNPYIQNETAARMLAQMLRDRGSQLNPIYTLRSVPGIPQLNLGDRVRFQDSRMTSGTRDGFVVGIRWSFDDAYIQDISLIEASELFPYTDYFIVGVTALGVHGRCWY